MVNAIERVLILDTETTGLDPAKDRVIEVAAILYSIEHATVLEAYSSLIRGQGNAAEAINRIPAAALDLAAPDQHVWERVTHLAGAAGAFVAHRAEFDHSFAPEWVRAALPWVCSKFDIRWPKQTSEGPSLVALALEHGLGVASAHRAMTDCDMIARLFTRSAELGADLGAMLTHAMRPKTMVMALVSYDDRDLAKRAGFQWDGATKRWLRRMAVEDVPALPFKTREISP